MATGDIMTMHPSLRFLQVAALAAALAFTACSQARNTETQAPAADDRKAEQRTESTGQNPPVLIDDSDMAPDNGTAAQRSGNATASEGAVTTPRDVPPGNTTGGALPSEAPMTPPSNAPYSPDTRVTLPSEQESSRPPQQPVNGRLLNARSALSSEPGLEQIVVDEMPDMCIRLTGRVKTQEKKMQAKTLVQSATGAECVKNEIQVMK